MGNGRHGNQPFAATRAFLLLRYTLIAATLYLLIVEESFGMPPIWALLPVLAALASNVALSWVTQERLTSGYFATALVIGDTAWITIALLESGRFSGEFFYLYFLILLLSALGESLQSGRGSSAASAWASTSSADSPISSAAR